MQVINQQIDMDSQNDGISKVSFDSQDYWTGRLGARLKGRYLVQNTPIEPYVRANAWRTFGGSDTVTYDDVDRIKSDHKSSSADVGVGVVARLSSTVSVYLAADYNTNLDTNALEGVWECWGEDKLVSAFGVNVQSTRSSYCRRRFLDTLNALYLS